MQRERSYYCWLVLDGIRWVREVGYQDDMKNFEKVAIEKGVGQIKISCERYPEERMNLKWWQRYY